VVRVRVSFRVRVRVRLASVFNAGQILNKYLIIVIVIHNLITQQLLFQNHCDKIISKFFMLNM
jgi:hypothetical protein